MITPYTQMNIVPSMDAVLQSNLLALDAAVGSLITVNTATMSSGAVTVLNSTVATTSLSRILFARATNGSGGVGTITCVLNPGVSTVFTSTAGTDNGQISYQVVNSPGTFVSGQEPVFVSNPSGTAPGPADY